jgi:hypothetical protein
MLHAGHSDRAIAAQLHPDGKSIAAARATLGLPKARPGRKPAPTLEAAFQRHTKKTHGGHVMWTSHIDADGHRAFRWQGRLWTAGQAAFEIGHGRPAEGKALPICGKAECIAPAHMQDRAGRVQLATEMLTAGKSLSATARQCQMQSTDLRRIRDELGIPPHPPGTKAESIDDTFRRRTTLADDGHLLWPTTDYHIRTVEGASMSAGRYAFQQKYGRRPVGKVIAGCGTPRCVHPDHVEDRPMREALASQLATIFGSAA